MRIIPLTLFFLFISFLSFSQKIEFTYQAGLTSSIKRIVPIPSSNTCIIAEKNGTLLAWDLSTNKILCRLTTTHTEISDVIYCSNAKKILVAGEKGIEVINASRLLTGHTIDLEYRFSKPGITAMSWSDAKNILRFTTDNGDLLSFTGLNTLRNNKPSSIQITGIRDAFAVREIGDRICVLGRQKQAFFSLSGKVLFAATNNTTGLFGHAFNERDSTIYIAHEGELVQLNYQSNRFVKSEYNIFNGEHGALVLGLTVIPVTGEVLVGTNRNKLFSFSTIDKKVTEVFNSPDGSFTSLLMHDSNLLVGDFFGNVLVLQPGAWKKMFQLNEDATPSLSGVFLGKHNRMVSTHFGLRGFALRIWDLPTASLAKSFNVRGDIAYDVGFSGTGDTIYSGHTDGAVYRYYSHGEQYNMDTIASPERPFMYGSIFFNVELDKKSRRAKDIKGFNEMLEQPGILVFPADSMNSTELVFVNSLDVPEECKQGKLPSNYRVPEAYLAAMGLLEETSGWDIMERDLFYMRACSSPSLQMFLERIATKGIDTAKAGRFYRAIKGMEKIKPFFYINNVTESRTLQSFLREKPLYADISRMPGMALFFYKDTVIAWNGKTNRTTSIYTGMADMDFYYDFNENYIATATDMSGSISLYRINETGTASTTRWISFGEEDYLIHNPKGYYKIRGRTNRINFSIDKKPLSFQSFDLAFNRPDLIMKAVGASDSTLIAAYQAAAVKRITRSGLTSAQPGDAIPALDIANRDNISYQQSDEKVAIHLKGTDNHAFIDRYNIWINEVPLFGANGFNIRSQSLKTIDTTIEIVLSPGDNRIEASLVNATGIESHRQPLMVYYADANANPLREKIHFIGIGIDQFNDTRYNLQYSVKDIRDLSARLKEKFGNRITIDTLFNEQVTTGNVIPLKKSLLKAGINDKVIIAYSGHGLLSKDFDYYLSTYPVNFTQPEHEGLPYAMLEDLLDSIPSRKKLLLIDACHSGEVDKEDLLVLNEINNPQVKGLKPVQHKQPRQLGLKNSFELMQDLFLNVGKSTGATVISAAAGTQFALERIDLQNGVFTYAILEAMDKYPNMKVSELRRIVSERVMQLTNGRQVPTSRSEVIAVDWDVW